MVRKWEKTMKLKLIALVTALFSLEAAYANPPYVCKTASENTHQITVTFYDEAYVIQDNWNGPYKTTARYNGIILPVNTSVFMRNVEARPRTFAILSFNKESLTHTLEYSGFLAPDTKGSVEVTCEYVR